jgi:hypothetical protein
MMRRTALAVLLVGVVAAAAGAELASSHTAFLPAPHRKPPDLQNHGWVAKPLRIIAFVPNSYPDASELREWPQAIVQSKWLAWVERAYGVPTSPAPIGLGYLVNDMPTLPNHDATTTSVFGSWVDAKFASLGVQSLPNYQTIVIIFDHCSSPQSLDGYDCVSHHPNWPNGIDAYALSLGNPTGSADAQRDSLTWGASHEVAEAITDSGDGWHLSAVDKDHPWIGSTDNPSDPQNGLLALPNSSPFIEDEGVGNVESADMMSGSRWIEPYTPPGSSTAIRFNYVRVFSNYGNTNRDDPGVPPSPHPYYNVNTVSDWYPLALSQGLKTVTVTAWSTSAIPSWTVASSVLAWEGSSARFGAGTLPSPCILKSAATETMNNGTTFQLQVQSALDATAGTWCVLRFESAPATPSSVGDYHHSWYVGFYVTD